MPPGNVLSIERGAFNRAHLRQPNGDDVPANCSVSLEASAGKRAPGFRRAVPLPNKKQRCNTVRLHKPEFGRDTGYVCDACCAVVWDPMLREHLPVWKFCPCCGSELMAQAQTSYSDAAQEEDASLEIKIEGLGHTRCEISAIRGSKALEPRERSRRATVAPGLHPCKDRAPVQPNRAHVGPAPLERTRGPAANASATVELARKVLRTKQPSMKRSRTPRLVHVHARFSALDLLSRLKQRKTSGQSRFCDVCGHEEPKVEVKCCSCPSSFHKLCLTMQDMDIVPDDWTCHACKRRQLESSMNIPEENFTITDTARTRWKPPEKHMQCSSCGYLEKESMKCDTCSRWFCFACMCLSAATLPVNAWCCPECIGQDNYDEGRRLLIETSCRRVREEKVTAKEQDGFSQLVFDLSCTCNWDEWERNIDTLIEHAKKQLEKGEIPVVMPFHSLHYSRPNKTGMDKMMIRRISEAYAKHAKEEAYKLARVKIRNDGHGCEEFHAWKFERLRFAPNDSVRRLRIGYLSSDFVDHPTADLIQSALLKHDKSKFEIFGYSITRRDDSDYRRSLSMGMEHFEHFPESMSDKKCAERIAADGIHILVNLNGHTAGDRNGISALRPAPLQLVYLAYPGTMGADYIDYNVTDQVVCPLSHRQFYTERLLYMPDCYQTNSFKELYADILDPSKLPTRADHQLPDEPTFIFCNFCRLGRITPELFQVWMRILKRVPNSVIWLYKHPKAAVWRLQSQAQKAGVDPERLIFGSPCSPKLEHLKRVTLADLALDTLVYNGHTTASDMLWAGVPLVTMRGDNWPSLVATCIAEAAEMHEMVVNNLEDYEEKAVQLASQPSQLKKLKKKLAQKRTCAPLFDSGRWIRNFELSLDEVWRRYAAKEQDAGDIIVRNLKPVATRMVLRDDQVEAAAAVANKSLSSAVPESKYPGVAASAHLHKEPASKEPASKATQQVPQHSKDQSPKRREGFRSAKTAQKAVETAQSSTSTAELSSEGDCPALPTRRELPPPSLLPPSPHQAVQAAAGVKEKRCNSSLLPAASGQKQNTSVQNFKKKLVSNACNGKSRTTNVVAKQRNEPLAGIMIGSGSDILEPKSDLEVEAATSTGTGSMDESFALKSVCVTHTDPVCKDSHDSTSRPVVLCLGAATTNAALLTSATITSVPAASNADTNNTAAQSVATAAPGLMPLPPTDVNKTTLQSAAGKGIERPGLTSSYVAIPDLVGKQLGLLRRAEANPSDPCVSPDMVGAGATVACKQVQPMAAALPCDSQGKILSVSWRTCGVAGMDNGRGVDGRQRDAGCEDVCVSGNSIMPLQKSALQTHRVIPKKSVPKAARRSSSSDTHGAAKAATSVRAPLDTSAIYANSLMAHMPLSSNLSTSREPGSGVSVQESVTRTGDRDVHHIGAAPELNNEHKSAAELYMGAPSSMDFDPLDMLAQAARDDCAGIDLCQPGKETAIGNLNGKQVQTMQVGNVETSGRQSDRADFRLEQISRHVSQQVSSLVMESVHPAAIGSQKQLLSKSQTWVLTPLTVASHYPPLDQREDQDCPPQQSQEMQPHQPQQPHQPAIQHLNTTLLQQHQQQQFQQQQQRSQLHHHHHYQQQLQQSVSAHGHVTPQAEWAGNLAHVVTSHGYLRNPSRISHSSHVHAIFSPHAPHEHSLNSLQTSAARPGAPAAAFPHMVSSQGDTTDRSLGRQVAVVGNGISFGASPSPHEIQVPAGGVVSGGGGGAGGGVCGAAGQVQGEKDRMIEEVKNRIKTFVRALCNDEYRMHYKRDSATDAVKKHLKLVAKTAQNRLFIDVAHLKSGQNPTDANLEHLRMGLTLIDSNTAFRAVKQSSTQLCPSFHWLSEGINI